jgi:hypothetical protein
MGRECHTHGGREKRTEELIAKGNTWKEYTYIQLVRPRYKRDDIKMDLKKLRCERVG